jgi:hypothetical protein
MRHALPRAFALLFALALSACAPEGPTAFVTFNLMPDQSCVVSPEVGANFFLPIGKFDVSSGATGSTKGCRDSYVLNLLVNSYLRGNADPGLGRAEPNILQINSAEVRLMSLDRRSLVFNRESTVLPNPFLVTTNNSLQPSDGTNATTGIAAVEAIPIAYAEQLDSFDGQQILAEIQIFGTTTGDTDIDFKPFVYPINICVGCLSICLERDVTDLKLEPEDIYGEGCPDNAGADGRFCIDPEC